LGVKAEANKTGPSRLSKRDIPQTKERHLYHHIKLPKEITRMLKIKNTLELGYRYPPSNCINGSVG